MKFATSTGDYSSYCTAYEERIRHIFNAGFRHIDMSFYSPATEDAAIMTPDWRDRMLKIKDLGAELGVDFVQAHSPGGNPLTDDGTLLETTLRSIECCAILGIPNTVYHAGWGDGIGKEEFFRRNREFFQKLVPTLERTGVNLLIENSTRANMGEKWYFFTGADMKEYLEFVGHPLLHACWDTGHANIEGHQYQDLLDLGTALYAIHFNDNRGYGDEHISPYLGTMNMDEVMHGLLDCGYRGCFTMECDTTLRPAKYWQGDRRSWSGDARLANPPLILADAREKLLYETGKYILQQYDLWED